jgi:hypothetical protein
LQHIVLCSFGLAGYFHAQTPAQPTKHLLVLAEEKGYRHEAVSHAAATIEQLGRETGLWTTVIRTDTEVLTKQKLEYNAKNLNDFDAVLFYTAGELEMCEYMARFRPAMFLHPFATNSLFPILRRENGKDLPVVCAANHNDAPPGVRHEHLATINVMSSACSSGLNPRA